MADGSDEPHVVDPMVALAPDGADVVAASRYMRGGRQIGGPPLKRLLSRAAGLTLHWFAGVPTHDPTNNFKLYSRRFLDSVADREHRRLRAGARAHRQGDAGRASRRRGANDLAGSDRRAEQLQAAQVAARTTCTGTAGVRRTLVRSEAVVGPTRPWTAAAIADETMRIDGLRAAFARVGLPAWFVDDRPALGRQARRFSGSTRGTTSGRPRCGSPAATRGPSPRRASRTRPARTRCCSTPRQRGCPSPSRRGSGCDRAGGVDLARPSLATAAVVAGLSAARARDLERQPADGHARPARRGTAVAGALARRSSCTRSCHWRSTRGAWSSRCRVLAVTLPFLPGSVPRRRVRVGLRLTTAWNGSAWRFPMLLPPTLLALWVLRRRGGEWFAVPAVFPATQFYYVSMALPALVGRPVIAALLALPVPAV